jgi:hypothetical protein
MDSLPQPNELIGLFVAIAAALAFVSYLLFAKGMEAGLSRRRVYRTLVAVWIVVLGLLALLFGVRALVGTPLVSGGPAEGGLSLAQMTPAKWALTALAIVLVCVGGSWLRRTVQAFERVPRPAKPAPPAANSDSDETC